MAKEETAQERKSSAGLGLPRAVFAAACGVWIAARVGDSLFSVLAPPLFAVLLARLFKPAADAFCRALRLGRKIGGAVFACAVCLLAGWAAALLSGKLLGELFALVDELPRVVTHARLIFEDLLKRLPRALGGSASLFGVDPLALLGAASEKAAAALGGWAAETLGALVQGFPGSLLAMGVTAVGFIYLSADPEGAAASVRAFLPQGATRVLRSRLEPMADAALGYFRAALLLLGVTFGELLAGLTLIGAENALALSLLTAAIDFLPVLGCGCVLVPWAAVCFLTGAGGRGIALLVLLLVVTVVRQFLEPRLLGKLAGAHPFLALAATWIGWNLAGVAGMIAAPVLLAAARREEK